MGNNGHDGGKLKKSFNPGISYVQCQECGRRGFTVWNKTTADAWFKKHNKVCLGYKPLALLEEENYYW